MGCIPIKSMFKPKPKEPFRKMESILKESNKLESEPSQNSDMYASGIGPTAQEMKSKLQRSKYREERQFTFQKCVSQCGGAPATNENLTETNVLRDSLKQNKENNAEEEITNKSNKGKRLKKGLNKRKKREKSQKSS